MAVDNFLPRLLITFINMLISFFASYQHPVDRLVDKLLMIFFQIILFAFTSLRRQAHELLQRKCERFTQTHIRYGHVFTLPRSRSRALTRGALPLYHASVSLRLSHSSDYTRSLFAFAFQTIPFLFMLLSAQKNGELFRTPRLSHLLLRRYAFSANFVYFSKRRFSLAGIVSDFSILARSAFANTCSL